MDKGSSNHESPSRLQMRSLMDHSSLDKGKKVNKQQNKSFKGGFKQAGLSIVENSLNMSNNKIIKN